MRILQRSASLSHSPLLALPAPRIAGLLPAPQIAGLLPARVPLPNVEIIAPTPRSFEELFAQLGPIRSREAMNADLVDLIIARTARMPSLQEHRP